MRIADSEAVLLATLADAGIVPGPLEASRVPAVVAAFRRFALVPCTDAGPADEDGDGLLAQHGVRAFRGRREFTADLTRQFVETGDDPQTWQLSCTLHWPPTAETEALDLASLWSFGTPPTVFFDEAAALPGWAWALAGAAGPAELVVGFDQV